MIKKRKAFIVGLKGYKITKKEINFLKKHRPWGVILFSRNIKSIYQTQLLTKKIRSIFKDKNYPIIIAPHKMSYKSYLKNTIIGCLTVMIDIEKTGEFQMSNIRSSHDMALWLTIMKRGFFAYGLDENLAYYRIVSTSNTSRKWKAAKEVWHVYRKEENL